MKENLSALLSLLAGVGIGINIIRLFIKRNASENEVEKFFLVPIIIYAIVIFIQNSILK